MRLGAGWNLFGSRHLQTVSNCPLIPGGTRTYSSSGFVSFGNGFSIGFRGNI